MANRDVESRVVPDSRSGADLGPSLLASVLRYRASVAMAAVGLAVVALFVSLLQATLYEAQARLVLSDPRERSVFGESSSFIDPSRYARNQVEVIESSTVAARTLQLLGPGGDDPLTLSSLDAAVRAEAAATTDVVTIFAALSSPEQAQLVANTVAEAYQQVIREQVLTQAEATIAELTQSRTQLEAQVETITAGTTVAELDTGTRAQVEAITGQIALLQQRADQVAVEAALYSGGVDLFEAAGLPESKVQPRPLRNAVLGAALGLVGGSAVAWWRAGRRRRAEDRTEPAAFLGAAFLGEVPDFARVGEAGELPAATHPRSVAAEAFHFIVASLEFATRDDEGRVVMVTSAAPGDGKSVTTTNIGVAAVQDGRRVVVVDADIREAGLTRFTAIPKAPGLTDVAQGVATLDHALRRLDVGAGASLRILPAGNEIEDMAGFFRSLEFRKTIKALRGEAELVLIDAPPLLGVADASVIAGSVDGIVLVVRHLTPLPALAALRERLDFLGVPAYGYVYNFSDLRRDEYGYGYGYGYGRSRPRRAGLSRRRAG